MQVFYRVVQFSLSDKTRLTVVRRDVINSPSEMLIKTIQACYSLYGHFSHLKQNRLGKDGGTEKEGESAADKNVWRQLHSSEGS